jgi:hypothetical protein
MNYRDVTEWSLGGNDEFGVCAFCSCANQLVLLGQGVMNDGEVLNAARVIEGLNTQDKSTDRGENMEALFDYVKEHGWPSDPTLKIWAWSPIERQDIAATIALRGSAPAWLMLPMTEDGMDYSFSDEALFRGAGGKFAHAVCLVEDDGRNLTFVTWARIQTVSRSWWESYGRQAYDVQWTDIA